MSDSSLFTGASRYSSDFQAVIDRAVAIASLPLTQMQSTRARLGAESVALNSLESKFGALQAAIQSLESHPAQRPAYRGRETAGRHTWEMQG